MEATISFEAGLLRLDPQGESEDPVEPNNLGKPGDFIYLFIYFSDRNSLLKRNKEQVGSTGKTGFCLHPIMEADDCRVLEAYFPPGFGPLSTKL